MRAGVCWRVRSETPTVGAAGSGSKGARGRLVCGPGVRLCPGRGSPASTRGGEFDRILRTRPPRALLGRDSGDSAPGKHAESTGTECVGSLRPEKGVGGTVASGSPELRVLATPGAALGEDCPERLRATLQNYWGHYCVATHGGRPPPWRRCPELAVVHRRSGVPPIGSSYTLRFLVQIERQGKAKLTRAWISSREAVRGADVVVRRRSQRCARGGGYCRGRGRRRGARGGSWRRGDVFAVARRGRSAAE